MSINKSVIGQARTADVIAFLEKYNGFTFALRGGVYRCSQHQSLAVKGDRLSWYWHSKGIGGHGVLDYLINVEGVLFREAVEIVTGTSVAAAHLHYEPERLKVLVLPEKRRIPLRLHEYLCRKRGIDSGIVNTLIQKEMLYEDKRGNVVFVAYDEHGQARFASLRGTYGDMRFRGDCAGSDKRYGFTMAATAPAKRLYIFESPIDAMSHASLVNAVTSETRAWTWHNRLSLAGTSDAALPFFLNQHTEVSELVFCLDNDPPGREAAMTFTRKYAAKGYATRIKLPKGKDFNDDINEKG